MTCPWFYMRRSFLEALMCFLKSFSSLPSKRHIIICPNFSPASVNSKISCISLRLMHVKIRCCVKRREETCFNQASKTEKNILPLGPHFIDLDPQEIILSRPVALVETEWKLWKSSISKERSCPMALCFALRSRSQSHCEHCKSNTLAQVAASPTRLRELAPFLWTKLLLHCPTRSTEIERRTCMYKNSWMIVFHTRWLTEFSVFSRQLWQWGQAWCARITAHYTPESKRGT